MSDQNSKLKEKTLRKMTFHLYRNQIHEQTHVSSFYKYNAVTGKKVTDPFKFCKTLKEVKTIFLTSEKKRVLEFFDERFDFVLFKINKRGLSVFQQLFPHELNNSVRFILED